MVFPEVINILGVNYTVDLVEGSIDAEEEFGRISFRGRVIRVQDVGDEVVNWQTLMHEILHAISYHLALKIDDTDEKHEQMDVLASALVDTLTRSDILVLD